jgi:hypothetical protein
LCHWARFAARNAALAIAIYDLRSADARPNKTDRNDARGIA